MHPVRVVTVCLVAAALFSAAVPAALSAEAKIAYVDMQSAMERSRAGKEALALLDGKAKEYTAAAEKLRDEIEALSEELKTKGPVMSAAEKSRREESLTDKRRDLEYSVGENKKRLQRDSERYTDRIRQDMLEIIKRIGKDRGYTLVLEKTFSAVLYAPKEIDLTDEVTREYDKGYTPRSLD